ncbi:MAG: hypothetical protein JG777_108 [Clostridia bacterium]|nr:hypothetical protein [Clostridia bacterium]
MKRLLSIVLVVLVIFSVSACAPARPTPPQASPTPSPSPSPVPSPSPSPSPAASPSPSPSPLPSPGPGSTSYKDGTYTADGDKWQYGNENATVVIKDGKMTDITLRRLDIEGKEVNYDEWAGQEVDGKKRPNLKQFRKDLASKMLEKQTYEVDSISGATVSSNNWKLAVQRALKAALK